MKLHFTSDKVTTSATREDVALAYQVVLGRMPDDTGLSYFSSLAKSQHLSTHDIAKLLISSEEFRAKGGGGSEPVEVPFEGYSIFVRPSDRDIGSAIAKGVAYEPHVTALVRRELRHGDTFLDVGANLGFFTMLGAALVGERGKVLAVEPMDKNLQLIYLGIEKNAFKNIEVFPLGASDKIGIVSIVTDPNTSNALIQSSPSSARLTVRAPVRTLDWICRDLDRLDFMKMDIEGHEVFAWKGAARTLEKFRPRVATEFHPHAMWANSGIQHGDYLSLMFDYSRSIQVIVSANEIVECFTAEQVMEQWEKSDRRHGGTGTSHLDLFLRPED